MYLKGNEINSSQSKEFNGKRIWETVYVYWDKMATYYEL